MTSKDAHGKGTITPIKVLLVEDNPLDAELELEVLRSAGLLVEERVVWTEPAYRAALGEFDPDVILCDFVFPDFDGETALRIQKAEYPIIPLIFVSGTLSEEHLVVAVQNGAVDYVQKSNTVRLAGAVLRALERAEQRRLLLQAETRLARLGAIRDVMSAIDHAIVRHRDRRVLFSDACRIATEIGKFPLASIVTRKSATSKFRTEAWAGLPLTPVAGGWAESIGAENDPDAGPIASAVRTGAPSVVNDLTEDSAAGLTRALWDGGVRSMGGFPLIVSGEVIGAMFIAASVAGFFNVEEIALMTDVASNLSFALDSIEGQSRVVRLSRVRDVLSAVNEAIVRETDSDRLYHEVSRIALELGGYLNVFVVLVEGERQDDVRVIRASANSTVEVPEADLSIKDNLRSRKGLVAQALEALEPIVLNDVLQASTSQFVHPRLLREGVGSIGVFPLIRGGRGVGAISFDTAEAGYFDAEEIALLSNLANNLTYALDHLARQHHVARLSRIRDVLSAVNEAIVRETDGDRLYYEVSRIALQVAGYLNVFAITVENDGQDVRVIHTTANSTAEVSEAELSIKENLKIGQGLFATAVRDLKPVVINDVLGAGPSQYVHSRLLRDGVRAIGVFPLIRDARGVGAMTFDTDEAGYFDDEEVTLLSNLTNNLSFALENLARQRHIVRLSRIRDVLSAVNEAIVRETDSGRLYREVSRIALEIAGYLNVIAVTVGADHQTARVVGVAGTMAVRVIELEQRLDESLRTGQGTVAQALKDLKPAVINDLPAATALSPDARDRMAGDGVRAVGAFPLIVDGRGVGALVFQATEAAYFDAEEIGLLTDLTNNVSFALNHIEQQARVTRLSRIRAVLSAVNEAIVRETDGEQLYREVCRIALEIAGYVNVLAVVVDDDKPLRVVTAVGKWSGREGELERMLSENLKLGRGVLAQALSASEPAIGNDLRESSPLREVQDALLDDDVRAIGAFPLIVDGRCVGALAFDSAQAGYFDDEEIGLLTDLTNNFSAALGHLRRQARLARLSRMRDVLSAVNAAIVRIRDRDELFGEACRIAVEVGGFANAMLAEIDLESRQSTMPFFRGRSNRAAREETLQWRVSDKERGPGNIELSIRLLGPVVDNDVHDSDNWAFCEEYVVDGIQAVGAFPIVVDGRAAGAMVFETEVRGYFDAEEIELLTNLTNNIAFCLNLLEKQKRVEYLSYYDALTGLPNRTLFYDRLGRDTVACKKAGKSLALAIIDLSRFSVLNNTLGEQVGDEVLRRIAARLREFVGEDRIARIGGDEFAVSFPMIDDLSPVAALITSDGIKLFQAPFTIQNRELQIAACAGCAVFPSDGEGPQELFQNAEAALLSAKTSGATYRFYSPELNVRLAKELDLEARLQRAVEDREFVLYYQPKVDTVGRKIVGFEGLLRWKDPERGLVPPGMFIPMLERTGMIIPVGRWALIEAARQYERWRRAGLRPPRVAINLSAVQLREGRLLDDIRSALARFEEGCGLDLEVTESMLVDDIGSAIAKLTEIRALGPHISLDDFGTGYSSLAYLHQLPLNALKIDRSFITGMFDDVSKRGIVSTIVALGRALNLTTIAEGVEVEQDARLLEMLGCDQIQGYLISKPVPADEAALLLTSNREEAESRVDDDDP